MLAALRKLQEAHPAFRNIEIDEAVRRTLQASEAMPPTANAAGEAEDPWVGAEA